MMDTLALALVFFFVLASSATPPTTQYLATVNHPTKDHSFFSKRSINNAQFIGNLIINNTENENGEVTISLCDITKDLFGSVPSFTVFDFSKSGGLDGIVTASLTANMNITLQLDGCLQFFFNPCCETLGLRFVLDSPVVLAASGSAGVSLELFSLGEKIDTGNVDADPFGSGINLAGFAPTIGSWLLPPILDGFASISFANNKMCADLGIPGVSDLSLQFCVVLNNLTSSSDGVSLCPGLTISWGTKTLLDIVYSGAEGGCLPLSFIPSCSYGGAPVAPTITQLFKSIDVDNDYKISPPELTKSKALLGIINSPSADNASFAQMDINKDGVVEFSEFQTYTNAQSAHLSTTGTGSSSVVGPSGPHDTFTTGDLVLAVILTFLSTAMIVSGAIFALAQYKGAIALRGGVLVVPSKV